MQIRMHWIFDCTYVLLEKLLKYSSIIVSLRGIKFGCTRIAGDNGELCY